MNNRDRVGGSSPDGEPVEPPPEHLMQFAVGRWAAHGKRTELITQGLSMWPAIRSGDRVTMRHGGAPPDVGQVVVMWLGGRRVAHRVIGRRMVGEAVEVCTKGDFTLVADAGWIGPDRLVGVVEAVVRRGKALRRPGLQGRASRLMATASRWQGLLCSPLRRLRLLRGARRANSLPGRPG